MDHKLQSSSPGTDARVLRTRTALHTAFHELLAQKPFDQLTVREITDAAGTGYATFFRHYTDLDALLTHVASAQISELLAQTMPIFQADDPHAACVALCEYVDRERALWHSLLTGGAFARVREEFQRKAGDLVAEYDRRADTVPPALGVAFATSAVLEILAWWLRHGSDAGIATIADYIDTLAVTPVVRPVRR